jgi:HPr kinase/phosphorylase
MLQKEAIITVRQLLEYSSKNEQGLQLHTVSETHNLNRKMLNNDINRPGMNLFGFYKYFVFERVQVFGNGESAYVEELDKNGKLDSISHFFDFDIPVIVFTNNKQPPKSFLELAKKNKIPILVSELSTNVFVNRIQIFFSKALAPRVIFHGVMMDVFGIGILIEGKGGIGKSECALELIERGHRFIADDVVDIRLIDSKNLLASSSQVIAHHMEIQGIGVINIANLFGVGAIRNEISVDMIIHIEPLNKKKKYDRLGLETEYKEILGINVPIITIPVQQGTNIPILIETATMNQRLKFMGFNPAKEFNKKLSSLIQKGIDIY